MDQQTGPMVMVVYTHPRGGKRTVTGPVSKKQYGYRERGDKFEVFEADVRARPDLFRPIPQNQNRGFVTMQGGNRTGGMPQIPRATMSRAPIRSAPPPPPAIQPPARPPVARPGFAQSVHSPLEMDYDLEEDLDDEEWGEKNVILDTPVEAVDWDGKLNSRHVRLLVEAGYKTLGDFVGSTEADLLKINGIGDAVTRAVFLKLKSAS